MLKEDIKLKFIRLYNRRYLRGQNELERGVWFGSLEQWRKAREVILKGVHKSGTFLDVGCANGILLRDLRKWAKETRGLDLIPYGIDIVEEFVEEGKQKNPGFESNFRVAEAMQFRSKRKFTFIRISASRFYGTEEILKKYFAMLERGGRLIFTCYFDDRHRFNLWHPRIPGIAKKYGYKLVGIARVPYLTRIAWLEKVPRKRFP